MSKLDFFLPFHLPMVIKDNNPLNIKYNIADYDADFPDCVDIGIPDEYKKDFMHRLRLKLGVYQTIKTSICNPLNLVEFSISLN